MEEKWLAICWYTSWTCFSSYASSCGFSVTKDCWSDDDDDDAISAVLPCDLTLGHFFDRDMAFGTALSPKGPECVRKRRNLTDVNQK